MGSWGGNVVGGPDALSSVTCRGLGRALDALVRTVSFSVPRRPGAVTLATFPVLPSLSSLLSRKRVPLLARVVSFSLARWGGRPHPPPMPRLDELADRLSRLASEGLLRAPDLSPAVVDSGLLLACTNDYLGLGRQPVSRETLPASNVGSGASRLIHGTHPEHLHLEETVAAWVGLPSALLFASGYAANLGAVSALCDRDTFVVSDALNHASLIDGCRLSRATIAIAQHLDLDHLESLLRQGSHHPARWVVTESYFSMDGDSPNLPDLRNLCDRYDANLLVDEAHALGVFGPSGAGLCALHDVLPDVLVGTLGKAAGASGAFVAGPQSLQQWLWNRARSFVFSTAPSPLVAALATQNVETVKRAAAARERLRNYSEQLRGRLASAGVKLPAGSYGPIIPIVLGDPHKSLRAADHLARAGILTQAIRPPTVPAGSSRLRVTLTASMSSDDIDRLITGILEAVDVP